MAVQLNHTIVASHNKDTSANFLASILGLPEPKESGHFVALVLDNGVTLDFDNATVIRPQHYAFRVDEETFDSIFKRVQEARLTYYADPGHQRDGKINHWHGGRGFYFSDPNGHNMEVLTRPDPV